MLSKKTTASNFNEDISGIHQPVMKQQVLEYLAPRPEGIYLDATLGLGGHSEAILEAVPQVQRVIGMDWDQEALSLAKKRLGHFAGKMRFYQGNFRDMDAVIAEEGIDGFDGIVMDLGLSSFQLDASGRGFSFMRDEPLDMRMDRSSTILASDMVNNLPGDRLAELIKLYGEEPWAKRIADFIVKARTKKPILSTLELAEIVKKAIPRRFHPRKIHPATRTFQAIRIAINRELENLNQALEKVPECLKTGGRIVVISFHSLEDRIVKHFFKKNAFLRVLTKKPVQPDSLEIAVNPRARSAKLRAAERER